MNVDGCARERCFVCDWFYMSDSGMDAGLIYGGSNDANIRIFMSVVLFDPAACVPLHVSFNFKMRCPESLCEKVDFASFSFLLSLA